MPFQGSFEGETNIFPDSRQLAEYTRGIPDYNFQVGDIRFIRAKKKKTEAEKENEEEFKAFEGTGQSLRQAKKKWFEDLDYLPIMWDQMCKICKITPVISCITKYELTLPKKIMHIANNFAIACVSEFISWKTQMCKVWMLPIIIIKYTTTSPALKESIDAILS